MKSLQILIIPFMLMNSISCNNEDPFIPNEDELITTVLYTLTPTGGGEDVIFSFRDLDGEGSTPPVIVNGILAANTTYTGVLSFLNETTNPPEDIAAEVAEESEDHQVFYIQDNTLSCLITYGDNDINGDPLGLMTFLETGDASTGNLVITLKHKPVKPNDGTLEDAGGVSDVEVVFNATIQ